MLPKVFYNDECSVCNIEIDHYKKRCTSIEWVGIHQAHNIKKYINKTPKEIIRRLHLKKNDEILIGVDAFIYIWSQIPKYKILSIFVKFPIIYHLSKILYEILAFLLYLKNYNQIQKLSKKF